MESKMRPVKHIFLFVGLLFATINPIFAQVDAELVGIKKNGDRLIEFRGLTVANIASQFQFRLSTGSTTPMPFDIYYEFGGTEKKVTGSKIEANIPFVFPSTTKFISLEKKGTHTFTVKFANGHETATSVSVIEEAGNQMLAELQEVRARETDNKLSLSADAYSPFLDEATYNPVPKSIRVERSGASELYKRAVKSVPLIIAEKGLGSGVVIDSHGLILTNWHVVEGNKTVKVVFKPNAFQPVEEAENYLGDVIKGDEEKDLALVKLRTAPENISPVKFADASSIDIAMEVHAIGHPRGNFWTYTKGVVSQIRPGHKWQAGSEKVHLADVIQTQTPINPGNSGGPLLDSRGEIVGINSFGRTDSQGLNFAVAVTSVSTFLESKVAMKNAPSVSQNKKYKARKVDLDKDGRQETTLFDENQNGIYERVERDLDNNGKTDLMLLDKNENKIFELKIEFVVHKGKTVAIWNIDKDEDKKMDFIGVDIDLDGKLDKVEPA